MRLMFPPKPWFVGLSCLLLITACQPSQSQDAVPEDRAPSIDTSDEESAASSQVESSTTTGQSSSTSATSQGEPSTATDQSSSTSATSQVVQTTTAPQASSTTRVPTTTVEVATTVSTSTSTTPVTTTTTLVATTTTLTPAPAASYSVDISGFTYVPSALTIRVGDSVVWTNRDSAIHTVTFRDSSVTSSAGLQEGDTHSVTFTSPGTFSYVCSPHTSIQGTITFVSE